MLLWQHIKCASFSLSTYKQMPDYVQCFVMALVQTKFTECLIGYTNLLQQHVQLLNGLGGRPTCHDVTDQRKHTLNQCF